MNPTTFPEQNHVFGLPPELEDSQCGRIAAHVREIASGSLDGSLEVIVAWTPSLEDLYRLSNGHPIFISFIGGMPPHRLSTSFEDACTK